MTAAPDPRGETRLQEAGAWCVRLAESELTHEKRTRFEAWLTADPLNRLAFDDAVRVWRTMEETSVSPDLIELRRDALESLQRANQARWSRGLSRRWRMAAAITLALGLIAAGGVWLRYAPDMYETGVGERRTVILSDGSKLSLDAATEVAVRYRDDRRDLKLERGRAKFDVAKDPLRPFAVAAANRIVVATGTEFSVELLPSEVRVILYEGRVAVLSTESGQPALQPLTLASLPTPADQMLIPGRELVTKIATPVAQVAPIDTVRSLSWESGQLVFVNEPLASAVERVNRYSDQKLAVGDAGAGKVNVNGVFAAGDTAAFVEGVTGVLPVSVRAFNGHEIFVSRAKQHE